MWWIVMFLACGSGAPHAEAPADAPEVVLPEGLEPGLYRKLCRDACAGPRAVTVWRNAENEVELVVFQGDLAQCSHVMKVWFDPRGRELLAISDRPARPDEAAANIAKIDGIQEGLTADEPVDCAIQP